MTHYVIEIDSNDGSRQELSTHVSLTDARSETLTAAKAVCSAVNGRVDQLLINGIDTMYRVYHGNNKSIDITLVRED